MNTLIDVDYQTPNSIVFETLKAINLKLREQYAKDCQEGRPIDASWCRDFATISWDAGIRTGRTTWLLNKAKELSSISNTLVIGPINIYEHNLEPYKVNGVELEVVSRPLGIGRLHYPTRHKSYDYIFLDTASYFNKRPLYESVLHLVNHKTLFVFVG